MVETGKPLARGKEVIGRLMRIAALAGSLALGACAAVSAPVATGPAPAATSSETIAVSVGPCFGFCPVYDVAVAPDGSVVFTGTRHTAVLGERRRAAGAAAYRSLAADLATYRPATGSTQAIACDTRITDTSTYTISWTASDGTKTVATHQGRCHGGPGEALDATLLDLPQRLGIADWARQTTRPGVSRG